MSNLSSPATPGSPPGVQGFGRSMPDLVAGASNLPGAHGMRSPPDSLAETADDPLEAAFVVSNPFERLRLLDTLRQGKLPVVISNPDGAVLCTQLWGVDEAAQRLNFSARDDSHQLDALVEGAEAVAVAYVDAVQIQFGLEDLMLVRATHGAALQTRLPQTLYRFQRRHAFRVPTAKRDTPQAYLRHPAIPDMPLALRLLDISLGGCALWVPNNVPPLPAGVTLTDVRVELDTGTQFNVQLTLRHVASMGAVDGNERGVRVGCAWRPNNPAALRLLQRWIDQSQKRMRLLAVAGTGHSVANPANPATPANPANPASAPTRGLLA